MAYIINAWLDRPNPELTISNKEQGTTIMAFKSGELEQLVESGELCPHDLLSNNTQVLEDVILNLALYRCMRGAPSPL